MRAQTRSTESHGLQGLSGLVAYVLLARHGADVASSPRTVSEGGDVMSRAGVGIVVEKLLADENLRIRFALEPLETVAELLLQGFDLAGDEIDLFCRTDPRVWFLGERASGEPERHELRRSAFA
jgi:hypothetical protein